MGLTIILSVVSLIVGFAICYLFFRKTTIITKEIVKEVIKLVEVNQVQVAEVVTEENSQWIIGRDYYKRKAVISRKYDLGILSNFKNGDILQYTSDLASAELILNTASIA